MLVTTLRHRVLLVYHWYAVRRVHMQYAEYTCSTQSTQCIHHTNQCRQRRHHTNAAKPLTTLVAATQAQTVAANHTPS